MGKRITILFFALALLNNINAQDAPGLTIGDAAPEIKYSKWLKGTPVNINNDKITILEFWATWCVPCIAAMPHLSELAKKYEKQADFIGVNIWEKNGDKPYESVLPNVERFVTASKDRMSYNVIVDDNTLHMANHWMKAAGINGIPSSFIIKNGKITWIGHPAKIDNVIDSIIAGTFNMAAFKEQYLENQKKNNAKNADAQAILNEIDKFVKNKEFDKAFALIDEVPKKQRGLLFAMKMEKMNILLKHFSENEVIEYVKQVSKEVNQTYDAILAITMMEKDGLKPETYAFAVSFLNNSTIVKNSSIYDKIAKCYIKAHDFKNAIFAQEKAVEHAKHELNDPEFEGRVFEYTITGYEKKLNEYKQLVK